MYTRIKASKSIIRELQENGYYNYLGNQIPWDTIDELDNDLEEIITRKTHYNHTAIDKKLRYIIEKGVSSKLQESSITHMASFARTKLERYISSGFTQSYQSLAAKRYFSSCSEPIEPSYEFQRNINEALILLKQKAHTTKEFEKLIINVGINHDISRELANFTENILFKYTHEKKEILMGGQIKLHPPRITDIDSINWHFDGDPRYIKILCYLDDQPRPDGSFEVRSNYDNDVYQGSHEDNHPMYKYKRITKKNVRVKY